MTFVCLPKTLKRSAFAGLLLACASGAALAAEPIPSVDAPDAAADSVDGVVVTGVRGVRRTVADSPAPIDVISSEQLTATGKVKVIGFDAGSQQVEDLQNDVVQGLIDKDPATIGVDGVDQAIAALSGQPVTPSIQTNLVALTKDNLAANAKYEYKTSC